jgi:hypothetical protein
MSVDEHDFEEEVEEVLNEYGGIDRTRCPAKDYKLVEAEVRSSAEFADRGAYRRNQHMALLTELVCHDTQLPKRHTTNLVNRR